MADLQGPKIRVGKFADGKVKLRPASSSSSTPNASSGEASASGSTTRSCRSDVAPEPCCC